MQQNSDKEKILQKLYNYCSKGEKCEFDIRKYLLKYSLTETEIEFILDKLYSNDFLNKERYVKAFINDKFKFNKWGKVKIVNELKSRGIDYKISTIYINEINPEEYLNVLTELLKNKSKQILKKDEYSYRNSLIRYALSKGFEYEDIEKVLKMLMK